MTLIPGFLLVAVLSANWSYRRLTACAIENAACCDRFADAEIRILEKLNRADRRHLKHLPQIVVPIEFALDPMQWSPMPTMLACEPHAPKLLVVHVPSQCDAPHSQRHFPSELAIAGTPQY